MAQDSGEKTEAPTPKKLADAAKQGDLFQSKELMTAMVMAAGVAWLMLAGPLAMAEFSALVRDGLMLSGNDIRNFDPGAATLHLLTTFAISLSILLGLTLAAAIAGQALLGSFGFRGEAMAFKGNRISPLAGIKRIFGPQGLSELGKSFAKVAVVGAVGWVILDGQADRITAPIGFDIHASSASLGNSIVWTFAALTAALVVIGLADVPIQYLLRQKRLMMSRQQVFDEHKQSEGSPEVKAQIRQRRHAMLSKSTRKAVAEATVILTNPTHFAVALRYRPGEDSAPILVARGRGATAAAIRELAGEAAVPLLSYPMLTRAIYYTSREGQVIAEDLYTAVALILAFVFRIDAEQAARAAPIVDVPATMRFDSDGRLEA